MNTDQRTKTRHLLFALREYGVPLQPAVSLLIRVHGYALSDLSNDAGFHRNTLYLALRGERRLPPALRNRVKRVLGVDPWKIYDAG